MKKILIPTDFSDTANKARDYAINLAQLMDAEIILLHSAHIPHSVGSTGALINLDKIALEEAEQEMGLQEAYVKKNYDNITVHTLCKTGLLLDSIVGICNNMTINLIVLGTTGVSNIFENFLGSNASALVGNVKVPMITIPNEGVVNFPKHIVAANDLMESGEEKVFDTLRDLAIGTYSTIDFLFITEEEDHAKNKIERLKAANFDADFDAQYHPFHFRKGKDVTEEVLDYIEDNSFDLLVVVAHQRGFWEGLFHKSISKSLVKHAKLPLLILNE